MTSNWLACKFLTGQKAIYSPVSHIEILKEIQQPMLGGGEGGTLLTWQWGPVILSLGPTEFWELFIHFSGQVIDGVQAKAKHVKLRMRCNERELKSEIYAYIYGCTCSKLPQKLWRNTTNTGQLR